MRGGLSLEDYQAKQELLEAVQGMASSGLVTGTSGNVSLRLDDRRILITPTGYPYDKLSPDDLPVIDMEGTQLEGELPPSSERRTHLAVFQARPDAQVIMHTHSVYVSVCAVAGLEIPPIIDELVIRVGGGVPLAEYVFPGTWELGEAAIAALGERRAVLLRNHGLLVIGRDAREALEIAQLVERLAQVFVHARLLGNVTELTPDVVRRELDMFRGQA